MEFVHSLKSSQTNDTDLYNQNTLSDTNCYFENRLQKSLEPMYIPITRKRDSYSTKYSSENDISTLSSEQTLIDNKINSHYKIILNDVNNINDGGLIDINTSYNRKDDEVNFNYKDYNDKDYTIDDTYLLSKNKHHIETSVTNNEVYKTNDFWTKQVPDIKTNQYSYRDAARYHYDPTFERFALPKNTSGNYFKGNMTDNYSVPKVSRNYEMNYTSSGGNIVHEGKKKSNKMNKYKQNDDYSLDDDEGMLIYYDDNKGIYYNRQFGINEDKRQIKDPNGTNYNKFNNINKKMSNLSKYEQNIMIKRNDDLVSSMNYTMRYDN